MPGPFLFWNKVSARAYCSPRNTSSASFSRCPICRHVGKATVSLSNHLKVATHQLTVSYPGTSKLNASSAALSLKVTKASAAVRSSAPASIGHTARAKVSVKVTATGTTPGGTVKVYEGTKLLATGTLSGGKVTVTLPKLAKGKHTLHATY